MHQPQCTLGARIKQQIHVAFCDVNEGSDWSKRLSVQDQTIEATELSKGFVNNFKRTSTIGDIGDETETLNVLGFKQRNCHCKSFGLATSDGDFCSECAEVASDANADAPSSACDDDDTAIKNVERCVGHSSSVVSYPMATTWNPGPRPEWVEAVNAGLVLPIAAEAALPFDRDGLVGEAMARQGRANEGIAVLCAPGPGTGEDFLEGLDIALTSLETEANLHLLQICDWVRSDPGVRDEQIFEPLFVVGAPRTGTTVLHALLSADHRHRVPLGWEFLRPVPPPAFETYDNDPRIELADAELRGPQLVTGGLDAIHAYAGRMNKECLSAMSFAFRGEEFISRYNTPSYIDWLQSCDMTPAYEMHRLVLQILQRKMPTEKWVLKSPVHLHNLPVLLDTYPDAQLVITHRDPLAILGSVTSLIATLRWAHSDDVDTTVIGRYHANLYHGDLDGLVDLQSHGVLPIGRVAHGSFADFNADGVGVVARIYDELGIDLPDDVRAAMTAALAGSPREKHGDHTWSFDWLGLDADEQRDRFSRYCMTFGLTDSIN